MHSNIRQRPTCFASEGALYFMLCGEHHFDVVNGEHLADA